MCSSAYGFGVLRSRVWNQDLGSVRATLSSIFYFLFSIFYFLFSIFYSLFSIFYFLLSIFKSEKKKETRIEEKENKKSEK